MICQTCQQQKSNIMISTDQLGFWSSQSDGGWGPSLHERIACQLPDWRSRVSKLLSQRGSFKVDEVTVEQMYGGMRGIRSLVSDISHVDPSKGLMLRGFSIDELLDALPRPHNSEYPLVGGLYYLLLVGQMPTEADAWMIEDQWRKRCDLPDYVYDVIQALPDDSHPMAIFSSAILSMQRESAFACCYNVGIHKDVYWQPTLEDCLDLTARLPSLAAAVYNKKYRGGKYISPDSNLDWAANFAHMIGLTEETGFQDLCRLFFFLHSDHELGNASAHAAHLVGSTLSDVYYACAAGMTALAGPMHGLANQECLQWLLNLLKAFDGEIPTDEQIEAYVVNFLSQGRVIPGYGHAVLRRTDPRFMAQIKFGKKYMNEDVVFQLVQRVYRVVPRVLAETGKVSNPWPNVDAANGTLLYHFGLKEVDFYTVLFGVSRILGLTANIVWARALGQPIERPKSITTSHLERLAGL